MSIQDPSKNKASIDSLLNPQDSHSYPQAVAANHFIQNNGHTHVSVSPYESTVYQPNASYNGTYRLTTASWPQENDPSRRKVLNGTSYHEHQPQMPPHLESITYAYPQQRSYRPRMDDASQSYGNSGALWQQQQDLNMGYGAPSIAPIYSDERTDNYSSGYGNQAEHNSQVWQNGERSSIRLAVKETISNVSHPNANNNRYYYSEPIYTTPQEQYVQQQHQHEQQQQQPLPQQESQSQPQQIQQPAVPAPPVLQQEEVSTQPESSSSGLKRRLPGSPAPKAKRAKGKSKSVETNTGATTPSGSAYPSKRGYSAKKRSEAALISAQNDAMQKTQKGSRRHAEDHDNPMPVQGGLGMALIPELQSARCMSNRYKNEEIPKCVSCTRRWAGDTCRFQGIRYLMRDSDKILRGVSFNEQNSGAKAPFMEFPIKWNRKIELEHLRRSKLSIAKALLPVLLLEQEHVGAEQIVRRPRECDVRATCGTIIICPTELWSMNGNVDTCITSLFSSSFMCRLCGREVCKDCFKIVRELTEEPVEATPAELNAFSMRRDKHAHSNPFFLNCTKRVEHTVTDFTAVTRFVTEELNDAIAEMRGILEKEREREELELLQNGANPSGSYTSSAMANCTPSNQTYPDPVYNLHFGTVSPEPQDSIPPPPLPQNNVLSYNSTSSFGDPVTSPIYDDYTPSNTGEHITSIPIYRAQKIPASYYDPPTSSDVSSPVFSLLWRKGLPLLVKDVLPRFQINWTPQHFMEQFGEQSCIVVECQTETTKLVNVRQFFGAFGSYSGRTECLKLKDWPPTADFKNAFPQLYEDFSRAVPVPDYVRRDGVYNVGSHFPSNAVKPDLGPKMYNSMASSQEVGSNGSTRLHMDMADALNVMLHAEPCEDGTEGYAVWDLYRAEDSDKIRKFLKLRFAYNPANANAGKEKSEKISQVILPGQDPIHGQQFYLDVGLRAALWEEFGVKSFRIYQRPGDGVFIPAGCAHQVANISDCMKIAVDFVSPENIDRCEKLTKEFREQNHSKAWKEDVLQLRTMMWFAWQSCSLKEEALTSGEQLKERLFDEED